LRPGSVSTMTEEPREHRPEEGADEVPAVDPDESVDEAIDEVSEEDAPHSAEDQVDEPAPAATGHPAVDEVLRSLEDLEGRPVDEHVAVFEQAHERLRRALSGAGDDQE